MSTEETPFGVISSMETIPLPTIGMDVKEWDERHRKAKRAAQRSCSGQHPAPSNQHATNVASSVEGYGYESLDVAETKNEFERLKGECEQRAGKIAEARVTMEESLLHIARMQALLSQRGKDRMKVLKQAGLPSWTKWATEYAKKINYTMRTLQREIKALSAPRKEACPQCGRKSGHRTTCPEYVETPQRLTPLEAKLLGTAAAAHDAITYIEAGRIDQAIEHLRRHTPTMERIEDYIERGVKPTLLNPDGDAPEPHAATKAPGAPKDGAAPTMSAWRKFHSDFRGGGTCKLKYMEDASNALTDAFESGLSNMRTAKVLEILESKPELARKNADDFRQIAIALRWMAQDCEMLCEAITGIVNAPTDGAGAADRISGKLERDLRRDATPVTLVGDEHTARKPLTHIPRHDAVGFSLCERDGQSVTLNSRNRARLSESATCTECQRVKREAKQEYERQAREAEQWAKENPEIFEDEPEQTAQETVHYCASSKSRFTACGLRIGYGDRSLDAAALLHQVTCDDCLLACT